MRKKKTEMGTLEHYSINDSLKFVQNSPGLEKLAVIGGHICAKAPFPKGTKINSDKTKIVPLEN